MVRDVPLISESHNRCEEYDRDWIERWETNF